MGLNTIQLEYLFDNVSFFHWPTVCSTQLTVTTLSNRSINELQIHCTPQVCLLASNCYVLFLELFKMSSIYINFHLSPQVILS